MPDGFNASDSSRLPDPSQLYEVSSEDMHFFVKSETKIRRVEIDGIINTIGRSGALAPSKHAIVGQRGGQWTVINAKEKEGEVPIAASEGSPLVAAAEVTSQFAVRKIHRQSQEAQIKRTFGEIWRALIADKAQLSLGLKIMWTYIAAPCLALYQLTQEEKRIVVDRFGKHHLTDPKTYQEMIPFLQCYQEIIKDGLDGEEDPELRGAHSGEMNDLILQAIEDGKNLIGDATRLDAVNDIAAKVQRSPRCLIPIGYTDKDKQFCPVLALFNKNNKGELQLNLFHLRDGNPELSGTFLLTGIYQAQSGGSIAKEIDPKKLKHLIHQLSLPGSEAWTHSHRTHVNRERESQKRMWLQEAHFKAEGRDALFGVLPTAKPAELSGESWLLMSLGEVGAQRVIEATPLLKHKEEKHDFFHALQQISHAASLEGGVNKLNFLFHFISEGIDAIQGGKRHVSAKDRREATASMKQWIGRLENHCAKRNMDVAILAPELAAKIAQFKNNIGSEEEDLSVNLKGIKHTKKHLSVQFADKQAVVASKGTPWTRLSPKEHTKIDALKQALMPEAGNLSPEAAKEVQKMLTEFAQQADQLVARKEYRHAQRLVHEVFRTLPVEPKIWTELESSVRVTMTKSLSLLYKFQWEAHLRQEKTYLYPEETIALLKPLMAIQHMYAAHQVYTNEAPGAPFRPMKKDFFKALTTHNPHVRFGDPVIEKELDSILSELDRLEERTTDRWQKRDYSKDDEHPFIFTLGERDYTKLENRYFLKKGLHSVRGQEAEKLVHEFDPEKASEHNVFFAAMRQTCVMLDMQARAESVLCPHFKRSDRTSFLNWAKRIRNRAEKDVKETSRIQRAMKQLRFAETNREMAKLDRLYLVKDELPLLETAEGTSLTVRICDFGSRGRGVAYLPEGYTIGNSPALAPLKISPFSESSQQLVGEHAAAGVFTSKGMTGEDDARKPHFLGVFSNANNRGASEKQHLLNSARDKPPELDQFTYFMLSDTECMERNDFYATNVMEALNWLRDKPRLLTTPSVKRRMEMVLLRPLSLRRAMEKQPKYFLEYARSLNAQLENLKEADPETFLHLLGVSDLLHRYAQHSEGIQKALAEKGDAADAYRFSNYSSSFRDSKKPDEPAKPILEKLETAVFDRQEPNPFAAIALLNHYYHSQKAPQLPVPPALIEAVRLFQQGASLVVMPFQAKTLEIWIAESLMPLIEEDMKKVVSTTVAYQTPLSDSVRNHELFVACFGVEEIGPVSVHLEGNFKVFTIYRDKEAFEVRQPLHSFEIEISRKIGNDTYLYELSEENTDPLFNRGIWRRKDDPRKAFVYHGTQVYSLALDAHGRLTEIRSIDRRLTAVSVENTEEFVPYAHPDDLLFFKDLFGTIQEIHILSKNIVLKKGKSRNEWVVDHPHLLGESHWTPKVISNELQVLFKEELPQFVLPIRRHAAGQELLVIPWKVKVHAAKKKLEFLKEPTAPVEMVISLNREGKIKTTPSSAMYLAYLLAEKRNYIKALHFLEKAKKSPSENRELEKEQFMRIRDLIAEMQPKSLREMAMQLKLELALHELLNTHKQEGYGDPRYEGDMKRIGERYYHYQERLKNAPQEAKEFYKSSINFTHEETIELEGAFDLARIIPQVQYQKHERNKWDEARQELVSPVSGSHRKFDDSQTLKAKIPTGFSAHVLAYVKDFKFGDVKGLRQSKLTSDTILGHFFHIWNQILDESENFNLEKWELLLSKPISEKDAETYNLCEVAREVLLIHAQNIAQESDPRMYMDLESLAEIKKGLELLGGSLAGLHVARKRSREKNDPFNVRNLDAIIEKAVSSPYWKESYKIRAEGALFEVNLDSPNVRVSEDGREEVMLQEEGSQAQQKVDVREVDRGESGQSKEMLGKEPLKAGETTLQILYEEVDVRKVDREESGQFKEMLGKEPLKAGETTLQILYDQRGSYSVSERAVIEARYKKSRVEERNDPLSLSEFYSEEVHPGITLNDLKHEEIVAGKLSKMRLPSVKPAEKPKKPSLSDRVGHLSDQLGMNAADFSGISKVMDEVNAAFQTVKPKRLDAEKIKKFFPETAPADDEFATMRKAEKSAIRSAIEDAVERSNKEETNARHLPLKKVKGTIKELQKLSLGSEVADFKTQILQAYRGKFPGKEMADWEIIEEMAKQYQARTLQTQFTPEIDQLFTKYLVYKTAQQQLLEALKTLQSIDSKELRSLKPEKLEAICENKTRQAYELLRAGCDWQRYFAEQKGNPETYDLQERARYLLVTESNQSVIYRSGQLQVLKQFGEEMFQWFSLEMGTGKTTQLMPKVPDMLGHCLLVVPGGLLEMNSLSFDQSTLDRFDLRSYLFRSSINDPNTPGFLADQYYNLKKAEADGKYIMTNLEQIANVYHQGLALVQELSEAYQAVAKPRSTDRDQKQLLVVMEKLKWTKEIIAHLRKLPYFGDEVDAIFGIENEINRAVGALVAPDRDVMKASRVILTSIIKSGDQLGKHLQSGTTATLFVGKGKKEVQTYMETVLDKVLGSREFAEQYPIESEALKLIKPREALLAYLTGQSTDKPDAKQFDSIAETVTGPLKALFSETLPTMLALNPGQDFGLSNDEKALGVIVPKNSREEETGQRYSDKYEIAVAHQLGYLSMNLCQSETGTTEQYIEIALNQLQDKDSKTYQTLMKAAQEASAKEGEEFSLVTFVLQPENWELRLRLLDIVTVEGGYLKVCDEKIALNVQDLLFGLLSGGMTGTSNPFSMPYNSDEAMFPEGNTKTVEASTIVKLAMGCGEKGLNSPVLVGQTFEELLKDKSIAGIINEAGTGMEGLNTRQWVEQLRKIDPKRTFLFVDPQTRKPFLWEADALEPISYSSRELPKGTVVVWGPADTRGTDLPIDPSAPDGSIYYFPSTTSNLQKAGQSVFRNRQLGKQYHMKVCVSKEFNSRLLEDDNKKKDQIVCVGDVLNYCLDASIQQQAPLNLKAQLHKIQGHIKGAFLNVLFAPKALDKAAVGEKAPDEGAVSKQEPVDGSSQKIQEKSITGAEMPLLPYSRSSGLLENLSLEEATLVQQAKTEAEVEGVIFKMAKPYFFQKAASGFKGDLEATGTVDTLTRIEETYNSTLDKLKDLIEELKGIENGELGDSNPARFKELRDALEGSLNRLESQQQHFLRNKPKYQKHVADKCDARSVKKSNEKVKEKQKEKQKEKTKEIQTISAGGILVDLPSENLRYNTYGGTGRSVDIGEQHVCMTDQMRDVYGMIDRFDGSPFAYVMYATGYEGRDVGFMLCTKEDYQVLLNESKGQIVPQHRAKSYEYAFFQLTPAGCDYVGGDMKDPPQPTVEKIAKFKFFTGVSAFNEEELAVVEEMVNGPDSSDVQKWVETRGSLQQQEWLQQLEGKEYRALARIFGRTLEEHSFFKHKFRLHDRNRVYLMLNDKFHGLLTEISQDVKKKRISLEDAISTFGDRFFQKLAEQKYWEEESLTMARKEFEEHRVAPIYSEEDDWFLYSALKRDFDNTQKIFEKSPEQFEKILEDYQSGNWSDDSADTRTIDYDNFEDWDKEIAEKAVEKIFKRKSFQKILSNYLESLTQ